MEGFRSKSCKNPGGFFTRSYTDSHGVGGGGQQPSSMQDLRCYSASHAYGNHYHHQQPQEEKAAAVAKSKSVRVGGSGPTSSSAKAGWSLMGDAEMKRKKRVASYKVYAVEGKMKGSIKKSFRWIKATCSNVVYGGSSSSSSWW